MLIIQSLFFFINFYANKNVSSGITTTYMLQLIFFLFQLIFVFTLFLGMVMCANEFETKENQKLTEIKNILQHIQVNGFKTTTDNILL